MVAPAIALAPVITIGVIRLALYILRMARVGIAGAKQLNRGTNHMPLPTDLAMGQSNAALKQQAVFKQIERTPPFVANSGGHMNDIFNQMAGKPARNSNQRMNKEHQKRINQAEWFKKHERTANKQALKAQLSALETIQLTIQKLGGKNVVGVLVLLLVVFVVLYKAKG